MSLKQRSCLKCGKSVKSYSPMRKWCVDCRRLVSLEQAKSRKYSGRRRE